MKLSVRRTLVGIGLIALRGAIACSDAPAVTSPAPAASTAPSNGPAPTEPDSSAPTTPHDDAGSKPPSADSGMPCVQGASCSGDARCSVNEGGTYRYCSCSANKLACGERVAAPPTTCVQGASCTGADECDVDDGMTVARCQCVGNVRTCETLATQDTGCSVQDPTKCYLSKPDSGASSWLQCFKRELGTASGAVCSTTGGGISMNGIVFTRACPATTQKVGTTCAASTDPACSCASIAGPCVCSCDLGTWQCL